MIFWDTRQSPGTKGISGQNSGLISEIKPASKVLGIHSDDINCVAWSTLNPFLIATGSNDMKVCITDIRKISSNESKKQLTKNQRPSCLV